MATYSFELSAMTEDKKLPISVTALRADDYSPDAKNIIISVTTKYSNIDRKFSVPIDCFFDFIVDLRRLNANAIEPAHPETAPPTAPDEHQASCFALEEEKGEDWKGTGATGLAIKEAKPSL
jgi:hypothetical protein